MTKQPLGTRYHPELIYHSIDFKFCGIVKTNTHYEQMFGQLVRDQKTKNDLSLLALGTIVSGSILESHFKPEALSERALLRFLGLIFDALLPTHLEHSPIWRLERQGFFSSSAPLQSLCQSDLDRLTIYSVPYPRWNAS